MSYVYGAPCKARNFNVVYIWTYVWQRWKPSLSICCIMFQHWTFYSNRQAHTNTLHPKKRDWLKNLALEAVTTITLLPTSDNYYRKRVADKIITMNARNHHHPHRNHGSPSEIRIIKSIKEKLTENNARIAQADKGNSIVILPSQQYKNKVQFFI
jgi:hypothetical protein